MKPLGHLGHQCVCTQYLNNLVRHRLLAYQQFSKTDLLLGKLSSTMILIIIINYQERGKFSPLMH